MPHGVLMPVMPVACPGSNLAFILMWQRTPFFYRRESSERGAKAVFHPDDAGAIEGISV